MCFEIRKQKVFRGEDRGEMKLIEMTVKKWKWKWNVMQRNETDMWKIQKEKQRQKSKRCINAMCKFDDEMKWIEMLWNEM